MVVSNIFGIFNPKIGEDANFDYIIFFKRVETTNQLVFRENRGKSKKASGERGGRINFDIFDFLGLEKNGQKVHRFQVCSCNLPGLGTKNPHGFSMVKVKH